MTDINEIKAMALAYGACDKASGITSIKEAVELLMTPQGREFAVKSGFPTLNLWCRNKKEIDSLRNVFLDKGIIGIINCDFIAIGNTDVKASFSGTNQLYHVIVMHGASVEIMASNHAVVTVTDINSKITITNDGTAKLTIEKKGGDK